MKKQSKNKARYIIFWLIGAAFVVVPVLTYNAVNYDIFTQMSAMKLTFSAMLGFALIGIALLTKIKSKTGIYVIFIGALLVVMGEAAVQIGWSLLLIGGGILFDRMIWSKLALNYKVKWYVETGRKVVYTQSVE